MTNPAFCSTHLILRGKVDLLIVATYATSTDVSALRTLYLALIDDMEYSDSDTLAIYKQDATGKLNLWADAYLKLQNINASSATSYSSGVGSSFTKERVAEAERQVAKTLQDFADALLLGGVTFPSSGSGSAAYWSLGGSAYE